MLCRIAAQLSDKTHPRQILTSSNESHSLSDSHTHRAKNLFFTIVEAVLAGAAQKFVVSDKASLNL